MYKIKKTKNKVLSANLTVKGQVTIPKEIRDRLQINKGDKVLFEIKKNGEVILKKGILTAFDNLVETLSTEAHAMGYTPERLAKDLKIAESRVWDKYYGKKD